MMISLLLAIMFPLALINASGQQIPEKKIEVLNFDQFGPLLENNSDTTYVINFWATWCAPCVREIPVFEELHQKYSDKKLRIILVSLDFPNQLESRLIPFVNNMDMQNEVILLDAPRANQWIPKVDQSWTGSIPATIVYNKDSRHFFQRELHFDELEKLIVSMLN